MVKPSTAYTDKLVLKLLERYDPKQVVEIYNKREDEFITIQQVYNARRRNPDRRIYARGGRRPEDAAKFGKGRQTFKR